MVLGDIFLTLIPSFCTSVGITGIASWTRFCTRTCAMSEFIPRSNVNVRL